METLVRHRTRRALDLSPPAPRLRVRPEGTRVISRKRASEVDPHIAAMKAAMQSQQLEDPFRDQYAVLGSSGEQSVIEPPFNFSSLLRLPRENNMLRQCIDSMVTNVEGHGWRLEYIGPEGEKNTPQATSEFETLNNILKFPNIDQSLQELRERVRRDYETLGNAYVEIGRDRVGRIVMVAHVPGNVVRLTQKDTNPTDTAVLMPREGAGAIQIIPKRYRRFVQIVSARKVFFKEFGDPRTINPRTGREDTNLSLEESATEILHLRQYAPGTPYGLPRWVNQLPAILGSRQSELTNLDFFKENAIPALALLVSGGMITQSTVDEIEEQFLAVRGRESFNRILIIEAHGDEDGASQDGGIPAPKLELKSMQNERMKDALFQNYDRNNMAKIRSSFRIPPIFVGLSEEYSHATAKTSFEVAESQVFGPERAKSDEMWNVKILSTYNPRFWSFRSMPPRISDPADIMKSIEAFGNAGAMTPNIAIGLANDFFDLETPLIKEPWGEFPFKVALALLEKDVVPTGLEEMVGALELPGAETAAPAPGLTPEEKALYKSVVQPLRDLRIAIRKSQERSGKMPVRVRVKPNAR